MSSNVLATGGTSSNLDSSGNIISQSGWSGSGGGPSQFESQPVWQKGVVTQTSTQRGDPDVAWNADPSTGVPVYDSYGSSGGQNWSEVGGTSAASPSWAGLIAITDQGRALAGETALSNPTLMPMLYTLQSDFHDITTGSSQGSTTYKCGPGYDYVTGLGTPIANTLVPALIGSGGVSPITFNSLTVNPNPITEGEIATLNGSFTDSARPADPYKVTINWGDGSANTVLNLTPGKTTFSVNHGFTIASSDTVKVTVTDTIQDQGTDSVQVTIQDVPPNVQITNVPVGSQPHTSAINLSSLVTSSPPSDRQRPRLKTATVEWHSFTTATTPGLTFTPDDKGSYVVNLSVTDDAGGIGVASPVAIQVYDAPPSAKNFVNNGPVKVGATPQH